MPLTPEEMHDRFIDTLVDHVLAVPSHLSLIKEAQAAAEQVNSLSLDGLEMENGENGGDNHRAVRSVDRDLDGAKRSTTDLASSMVQTLLLTPLEQAVSVARDNDVPLARWNPERWLEEVASHVPDDYPQAVITVLTEAASEDADAWYDLINDQAPNQANLGTAWITALSRRGSTDARVCKTVATVTERYLNDDAIAEPRGLRAVNDPRSARDIKLDTLHKEAFQAYYHQNSSALQAHMWAAHGLDMKRLNWSTVFDRMYSELRRGSNGDWLQPVPESQMKPVVQWMTRLTGTGHLDGWLARPEQWDPVTAPAPQTSGGRVLAPQVKAWVDEHVKAGTFTWNVLIAGMEALNQPALAVEFRRLGERWSLAHEVAQIQSDSAPVVRERARL